jgi:hypothetical protein
MGRAPILVVLVMFAVFGCGSGKGGTDASGGAAGADMGTGGTTGGGGSGGVGGGTAGGGGQAGSGGSGGGGQGGTGMVCAGLVQACSNTTGPFCCPPLACVSICVQPP